ncbi:MAG: hypothetical protein COU32_04165 [Candidatus Magasanikbacteria bacterium CG10_big_fil_rev_8_21_14_0_10_42_10]|uniref:Uncharacterized protein n=2 Tax=Candidatus Magasanikiibacteriota TaxID=1752731 RepID=A0A2H0TV75_9BACT|nr:MAG: hypothetical protein COU32_04165 [Candidatus Magasanikbacteria bacterium CG10_big_fil_rev_8_21_14_0_10_42_10]PIZ94374.1 MAG: hypothetical protein COX82_00825 [Candidatus Magasanikbacteria bacterium CG_4_10_14_0_2_um_filter_41_10]
MPPKKRKVTSSSEEMPKKIVRKKKILVDEVIAPIERKETPPSPPERVFLSSNANKSSQKKHGSNSPLLFFIIILFIAVVGVYAYQKKQTDSVVSKLSTLENKLTGKIGEIEQGIDTAKQQAEEEKMNAIADATTKKYTSAKYDYSFIYPTRYKVMSVNTDIDETYKEQIVLMRASDIDLYADSLEGGPNISFMLYANPNNLSLVDWLTENKNMTNVAEDTELTETQIDGRTGYSYTWEGLGSADAIAVAYDGYILLGTGWYMDEANIEIRGDFQAMLQTLVLKQ